MKEEEEPFFFLVASSPPIPFVVPRWPVVSWQTVCVDFSSQSIHFNHNGAAEGVAAAGARGQFTNWLAGICIYSTRQNVTTGLGDDLCVLLAKQSDEGNLSCGSRSAEHGRPRPLLLASSVTCHTAVGTDRGMPTGGEERGELRRRRRRRCSGGTRGQEGRRDEATCQEVFTAESAASICLVFN